MSKLAYRAALEEYPLNEVANPIEARRDDEKRSAFEKGYSRGKKDAVKRVEKWLEENKTNIMGVKDIYLPLWVKDLEQIMEE